MIKDIKQPKQIRCSSCSYEWWTKSILATVNCPSCRALNKNVIMTDKK